MKGTLLALCFAVPLVAVGCIEAVTAPDRTRPEQRGMQVGVTGGVSADTRFAWSADGSSIFYRSSTDPASLAVVGVAGGAPVGLVHAWSGYRDIRVAGDGGALYFVADTGQAAIPVVFRLPLITGAPVGLGRTTAEVATRPAEGGAVLPSPRPDTAALIIDPDSVVLDGPFLRRFIENGCERLVAFSPDGARLLCHRSTGASSQYRILDIAAATLTAVDLVGPDDGEPLAIRWTPAGIVTLFHGQSGFGVHHAETGESRIIAQPPPHGFIADATHGALSPDARLAAYWTHTCIEAGQPGECLRGQSVLHVVDLATSDDAIAAVATGPAAAGHVVFSPDGSRLAYAFEETLYQVSVR